MPKTAHDWLPQTKFRPPLLRGDLVARPRLIAALQESLASSPLTLLSAPAGYGKTTLLATLSAQSPSFPLAWLTLDQDDNDSARFLTGLIAALGRLHPAAGATAQAVLESLPDPGAEARRVVNVLVNDLLETLPQPFGLVLDDTEAVHEAGVYAILEYLLEHFPPQMRIVIAARRDPPLPLARLRARGQLSELRLADLRFSEAESGVFLHTQLTASSPETLALLHKRAEGWPAGLRLLASSLERMAGPAEQALFLQSLSTSDRYTGDFLAEEVLNRQEEEVQRFLLQTSVLEFLTPELCRAVTGQVDAAHLLESVYQRNLFLVQLESARHTFRYHTLFAEFLQNELGCRFPQQWAELHRRAAEAQSHQPERAVRHFLQAGLDGEAARLVAENGERLLQQGHLKLLAGWLDALPATLRETRALLLYLRGALTFQRRQIDDARGFFEQALPLFETDGDQARLGKLYGYLAEIASYQLDIPATQGWIERALACSPPAAEQVGLVMTRIRTNFMMRQVGRLEGDLAEAFRIAWAAEQPAVFGVLLKSVMVGYFGVSGVLEQTEAICRQLEREIGSQPSLLRLEMAIPLTIIHFYRGRLAEAERMADEALALYERLGGGPILSLTSVLVIKGWLLEISGQHEAGIRVLENAYQQIHRVVPERSMSTLYLLAVAHYRFGERAAARRIWSDLIPILKEVGERLGIPDATASARFWLALDAGRYAEAEAAVALLLAEEDAFSAWGPFSAARSLLAYLFWKQNRPDQALTAWLPLLAECEAANTPGRILVDGAFAIPLLEVVLERGKQVAFARRLLEMLKDASIPHATSVPGTGETITPREMEVLGLLAAGHSNQSIADALTISLHTVKRHVAQILAKLGVASRMEAAARARELNLTG